MPKPVCPKCQRFYRCKKTGISWIEMMPRETPAAPGLAEPQKWQPYKLWQGDLFECQGCKNRIIVGHGQSPIAERFQKDFNDMIVHLPPICLVNDC